MPDTLDVDALTAAAAHAASLEDAAGAAALLRQALDRQIAQRGPHHRDLAPTLNNLALMLERQGEIDEAERCYRRAYDIARAGAGPDDPLVQVSRANLVDFLRAAGRPANLESDPAAETSRPARVGDEPPGGPATPAPTRVRSTAAPRPVPSPPAPARPAPAPPTMPKAAAPARVAPAASTLTPARLAAIAVGVALALALWVFVVPDAQPPEPAPVAAPPPALPPAPADGGNAPVPVERAPDTAGLANRAPAPSTPPPVTEAPARPTAGGALPDLSAEASLCESLSRTGGRWRCTPISASATPDAVYYYTRVKSPRAIVVRHRWTRNGTIVRTVNLSVAANTEAGFRTFSRQSLSGPRGAQWEVALLAPSGAVIDSQRFAVP